MPIGQVFTENEVLKTAEVLKIELSEFNKKLLMDGSLTEMIEVDGKKSKIALKRNNKGEVLATISHKKETLEIPDKIEGTKLSRNDKRALMDGETVFLKSKNGDVYLQIDRELNMIIVKGSKEMGIPNVIGDSVMAHGYKGYELSDSDKNLLANGRMLPPRVLASNNGYILAEFGMTDDRKGVKFANVVTIPKEEVNEYIAKYNSRENVVAQEKPIVLDNKQNLENLVNSGTDIEKLQYLSKSGVDGIDKLFGKNEELKSEFLKKHGLLDDLTSIKDLDVQYSKALMADNNSLMERIDEKTKQHNDNFKNIAKEQFLALGGIDESVKLENNNAPGENKVVVRNLDDEFLAALSIRDFEKLNKLAKDDQYEPSQKALEEAHKLPNLSDHDKVAIKTIFPEKERELLLAENGKEPGIQIVKDNKKTDVKIIEPEANHNKEKINKIGRIVQGAFHDM